MKLKYDERLSNIAFNFNLRHYVVDKNARLGMDCNITNVNNVQELNMEADGYIIKVGAVQVDPRLTLMPRPVASVSSALKPKYDEPPSIFALNLNFSNFALNLNLRRYVKNGIIVIIKDGIIPAGTTI